MVEIEIDGKKVEVAEGSMVMHAAQQLGLYVPHFCYHKKLSIAANCRMCLVEVEKAPKPLPACATPVTQGMKVQTASAKAVQAQKSVMEFLLINHPLDCPICDQGGECQLQDLAVGYGGMESHHDEAKRVVPAKNMGPLISAEEMSRCIQCTRCVRFGQEIAGVMELGMLGRGEHSEISSFVGKAVDSELSGNMIDVCPVGALTSKPFRYSARTWELSRRKSVSPHDSLGSNLAVQIKQGVVQRVLPLENEAVNECWISDRDRFSYEGLRANRLQKPMVRRENGQWVETDWAQALTTAAAGIQGVIAAHGSESLGCVATPAATLEELSLLGRIADSLGTANVDFRSRLADTEFDVIRDGVPWLGMGLEQLGGADAIALVGSFARTDHPLLTQRIRQAAKRGSRVAVLHTVDDDLLLPVTAKVIVSPQQWAQALAQVGVAIAQTLGTDIPLAWANVVPSDDARRFANALLGSKSAVILLGNSVLHQSHVAPIWSAAQWIANAVGATIGFTVEGANGVGGYLAGAVPGKGGLNAAAMMSKARKAYLLHGFEPEYDSADPSAAAAALKGAEFVVVTTPYADGSWREFANVVLPVGAFTETAGTYVNAEGRVQSFNGATKPPAEARPAWKVLRVLANEMGLAGFDEESAEAVRNKIAGLPGQDLSSSLSNRTKAVLSIPQVAQGYQRVGRVALYGTDSVVRRATSLQATAAALPATLGVSPNAAKRLGLRSGARVLAYQGDAHSEFTLEIDDRIPDDVVRIDTAKLNTTQLGSLFGPVRVEAV